MAKLGEDFLFAHQLLYFRIRRVAVLQLLRKIISGETESQKSAGKLPNIYKQGYYGILCMECAGKMRNIHEDIKIYVFAYKLCQKLALSYSCRC